jgi:glycosyltransferase involved in cell wall biosynthesis
VELGTKTKMQNLLKRFSRFRYLCIAIRSIVYAEAFAKLLYETLKARPKIIHANDWFVLPVAILVKVITGAKIIYDAHELESESNGVTKEMKFLTKFVEKNSWPRVNFFVTVSPSIAHWYLRKYGQKPYEIILNSPEIQEAPNSMNEIPGLSLRTKFNIPVGIPIFLYIGALERGRGISNFLAAFQQAQTPAAIVFMGQGSLRSEIESAQQNNQNIFFHPIVPHFLVTSIAAQADFGICMIENVSLSDWYCLPNKLFEYAFAGIPVVASKFPELERVVEEFGLGMCIDNDIESIKFLLEKILPVFTRDKNSKSLEPLTWDFQERKIISTYLRLIEA